MSPRTVNSGKYQQRQHCTLNHTVPYSARISDNSDREILPHSDLGIPMSLMLLMLLLRMTNDKDKEQGSSLQCASVRRRCVRYLMRSWDCYVLICTGMRDTGSTEWRAVRYIGNYVEQFEAVHRMSKRPSVKKYKARNTHQCKANMVNQRNATSQYNARQCKSMHGKSKQFKQGSNMTTHGKELQCIVSKSNTKNLNTV